MEYSAKYATKIGWILLKGTDEYLESLDFLDIEPKEVSEELPPLFHLLIEQLDTYFNKGIWDFSIPLKPKGTEFQQRVWSELQKIPFGQTISYLELAQRLGDEKVIRAAASANGKNPIAILIPCHRVIGKDGSLTGYASGLHRKEFLLILEGAIPNRQLKLF